MSALGRTQKWPEEGLEFLGRCPACRSERRQLMFERLTDNCFFVAPGEWTMWRCSDCETAYLDPRPNQQTISLAYENYYTHAEEPQAKRPSLSQRIRTAIGNDYRNAHFNSRLRPRLPFVGRIAAWLLRGIRERADLEYRCLPPLKPGDRLLDVGCGNGKFLRLARELGWKVAGVEPDAEARKVATQAGLDTLPQLEDWASEAGQFKAVTASHVVEHVHDPIDFLTRIRQLLRDDGQLYLETPNIDSPSRKLFGASWRGLETPRHLALFNRQGLVKALAEAGLRPERFISMPHAAEFMFRQSHRIAAGQNPYAPADDEETLASPESSSSLDEEFLAVVAVKGR